MMFQIDLKYIYISLLTCIKLKIITYHIVMYCILNDNDFHNQLRNYMVLLLYCSKDAKSLLAQCSLISFPALLNENGRKMQAGEAKTRRHPPKLFIRLLDIIPCQQAV